VNVILFTWQLTKLVPLQATYDYCLLLLVTAHAFDTPALTEKICFPTNALRNYSYSVDAESINKAWVANNKVFIFTAH
jgi:hypothetical protein